ncbi:hypothetical protein AB205_0100270 [Aquarana catesbeiana]|uniref:Uncharacterized protein n=1 Tax=Aquarana catesbeiana TaxID=8400 RepID=A0A2G9QJ93_AQUCT|nr:hypothetical protein AB205_0100270 [Aquarana catesbeiana]
MTILFSIRRGHLAAVYTSGCRSTSVGHHNTLVIVSQASAPVDTRGLSMCETCTKQISIPAFECEKIMYSDWNSAKTDNWKTLPSNVSYYYFWPNISVC